MPSASIISDFQRSSSNSSLSSSLLLAACQQYDINDLSYCFDQQQKLSSPPPSLLSSSTYDSIGKRSQNMTECVPVPSSEHVAEIVGRQGCKIKALRTKTNTYIKTPVRGDQPVFIITGRKEDVYQAKKEILSAAEHFSQIRAARKQTSASNSSNSSTSSGSNTNLHYNSLIYPSTSTSTTNIQQITIQVRVPYRVVGLVVGPKGATIKRIQQTTNTYIVTPGRDKEPVFEIAGLPENVEAARIEIESHIAARTGQTSDIEENDFEKELFSITDIIDTNQQCSKWIKLNNNNNNNSSLSTTITTPKFSHHLSLPFPQDDKIKSTYRTVSQSSFLPSFNDQLDLNSSFEQISDDNFDSIWTNFNFISMKTSMGFA
ncbi:unnamed protein product [Rotaria sp. Silwood1]|nr:unnamed protein product [Rotaria sp. Silwood1]CAF3512457.1 unnamed protein product [Rotaria sp. Silwood1]CAF3582573.1 unnamed protein product [Rotaria sp. Silwood1]CAF4659013.1 unnamed protein product [Rotaria sp. Silwood1]CAF4749624.1 unnamed protein product [Rotaria sp. Silwood1]